MRKLFIGVPVKRAKWAIMLAFSFNLERFLSSSGLTCCTKPARVLHSRTAIQEHSNSCLANACVTESHPLTTRGIYHWLWLVITQLCFQLKMCAWFLIWIYLATFPSHGFFSCLFSTRVYSSSVLSISSESTMNFFEWNMSVNKKNACIQAYRISYHYYYKNLNKGI